MSHHKIRAVFSYPENCSVVDSSAGLVKLSLGSEYTVSREFDYDFVNSSIRVVTLAEVPGYTFTKDMFAVYDTASNVTVSQQVEALLSCLQDCNPTNAKAASEARRKKYYEAQEKLARTNK